MYEKIVVAVDGSLSSLNALRQSFRITKTGVTVVCVAPRYEGDLEFLDLGAFKEDGQSLLWAPCEKALAAAEEIAKDEDASIKTVCESGTPHERIIDIVEARGCEVIVMGRKGYGRIERALMGSVTARVIGYSPVDVLVFPQGASLGWEKILLATDGSEYSRNATIRAMALAKAWGAELKVVSATDVASEFHAESPKLAEKMCEWPTQCVADVREHAVRMDVHPECIVRQGKAHRAILDVAAEQGASLIVVGSHGRTGLKRLLMGSVTEKVVGQASCPVLVVKR